MGEVYLAEHQHIGRKAAIKVLLPALSSRPDIVARFFNEARATGMLRHPGIVEILDCDVHASGRAYIVMELLEGETLGRCLARVGSFARDTATAAAITGEIAGALAAAHAKGIVHRDLKPDNVFLATIPDSDTPVRIKILDFGIAKLIGDGTVEARKTITGSLLGTPLYMSPEQCRGSGRIDHRTDIYSLGCIAFELLTGRPPFIREGQGDLIIAHNSEPPPDLATLVSGVPPALARLVRAMLAKEVADRPQTMTDVIRAIESLLGVPAARLAERVALPRDYSPAPGSGSGGPAETVRAPSPQVPSRSSPTMQAPANPDAAAGPEARPQPMAQSGETRVMPGASTTLSRAAAPAPPHGGSASPRRRSLRVVLTGGALAAIVALVVLGATRRSPPSSAPERTRSSALPATAETRPAGSLAAAPATPPPVAPVPAPAPKTVTIEIEHAPAGLKIQLDGKPARAPLAIPAGAQLHRLELQAAGFRAQEVLVDGSRDKTIVLNMQPLAPAPASAPAEKVRARRSSVAPPSASAAPRPPSGAAPAATPTPASRKHEGFTDL